MYRQGRKVNPEISMVKNCKQVAEFVSRSLDGELALNQRLLMRLHILRCAMCRSYERQLRFLQLAARKLASGAGLGGAQQKLPPESGRRIRDALDIHPAGKIDPKKRR